MAEFVLDASALIALVRRERGWETVEALLPEAVISAVNLAETAQCLRRHQMPLDILRPLLSQLVPAVVPFDEELAYVAATVHERTRDRGLSFGDCACLALALSRGAAAVTAERVWDEVDVGVEVKRIR